MNVGNNSPKPQGKSHVTAVDAVVTEDFKSVMKIAVENEWAKANSKSLQKKKSKKNNEKTRNKVSKIGNRKFQTVNLLHECLLEDQKVVDEASELLKQQRKNKVDAFLEGFEKIMDEKRFCNDGKLDGSMKAHYRRFFMYFDTVTHGETNRDFFNIEQYKLFIHNNTNNEYWFCNKDIIMAYFSDVVTQLVSVDLKNIKKSMYAMQKIVDVELFDESKSRHTEHHWKFKNDADFTTHLDSVWKQHRANYIQCCKETNEDHLEPMDLMMKETSRKDLIKIVTNWLEKNKKKSGVNESELEIIFMLIYDFKSIIRNDSCKRFLLKCKMMIQEDNDPLFQGLLVLPATEKVKENSCYPSCTIRDVNFRICGQFFLSFLCLYKMQIHGGSMCFLNKIATKRCRKQHWGNFHLISKTKGSSIGTKTKDVIVDANVNTSKTLHQRKNGMIHLTKRTEKNEMSPINEVSIKGVSRHESAKSFSTYLSWYNFGIFKSLAGYPSGVPYYNPREEQKLPVKVVGNHMLLKAFVDHYDRFLEEHNSDDGDGLNVSSMLLTVGLAYDVWILLQDAPLWMHHYPNHWISNHIITCIHRITDDETKNKIKSFILNGVKNIELLQNEHELSLRQNSIRESTVNQHTSNCVSKISVQISSLHHDNICQNELLKNLEKAVLNNSKMCMLASKLITSSNAEGGPVHADLIESWCKADENALPSKGIANSEALDAAGNTDNDFSKTTTISDHLASIGNVELNDLLAWECNIGDSIPEPHKMVDWWFFHKLYKEVGPGKYKKLGMLNYNRLGVKKNYMEVIFHIAKQLCPEMTGENMTFTSVDAKWKNQLLNAALKMEEERVGTISKGKVITPHAFYRLIRDRYKEFVKNTKKSSPNILQFAVSKDASFRNGRMAGKETEAAHFSVKKEGGNEENLKVASATVAALASSIKHLSQSSVLTEQSCDSAASSEKWNESLGGLQSQKINSLNAVDKAVDFMASGPSLSQESLSKTMADCSEIVDALPLTQEHEGNNSASSVILRNPQGGHDPAETLKCVLESMEKVSNKQLVDLYFQWKVYLMHDSHWWANATSNLRNQINRKHDVVLGRINNLEIMLINKLGMNVYCRISLVDLRSNLEQMCSLNVPGHNLFKYKLTIFLKQKRKEYACLMQGVVPVCYQNMSLNKDVFQDHDPMSNQCYRLPGRGKKRKMEFAQV